MPTHARPSRALGGKPWEFIVQSGNYPRFQLQSGGYGILPGIDHKLFEFDSIDLVYAFDLGERKKRGYHAWHLNFSWRHEILGLWYPLKLEHIRCLFQMIRLTSPQIGWRWEEWRPEGRHPTLDFGHIRYVYFIQSTEGGLIKIGYSAKPQSRLATMQSGCPVPLQVLRIFPAILAIEGVLHFQFKEERRHGEWFYPSDRLVSLIRSVPWGIYSTRLKDLGEPVPSVSL